MSYECFELDSPGMQKYPEWLRLAFISEEHDVLLPVALVGNEGVIVVKSLIEQVGLIKAEGHYYAQADWLMKLDPEVAPTLEKVCESALAAYKELHSQ